jgi:hypothetical protein
MERLFELPLRLTGADEFAVKPLLVAAARIVAQAQTIEQTATPAATMLHAFEGAIFQLEVQVRILALQFARKRFRHGFDVRHVLKVRQQRIV